MRVVPGLLLALSLATGARADEQAAICATCHATQAALAAGQGGHAAGIDCVTCHEDRRPGSFGHGHRSIPTSCTGHHTATVATHPMPAKPLPPARLRRTCLRCHDVHGSSNATLIRTAIPARGRLRPVDFHAAGGAVPGGFVDPASPGHGVCEVCHRQTKFYRADGRGAPHFTVDCLVCHDHAASFGVVLTDASCAVCHADEAARLAKPSLHNIRFAGACSSCHPQAKPEPGPGHRAIPACAECHSPARVMTHVPPGMPLACAQCHDPHGSDNLFLVRDVVHTTTGADRPVHFDSTDGRADGSFASASAPGAGLCEVCHTSTQFYRADGTGDAHFTTTCITCHSHATGFLPR